MCTYIQDTETTTTEGGVEEVVAIVTEGELAAAAVAAAEWDVIEMEDHLAGARQTSENPLTVAQSFPFLCPLSTRLRFILAPKVR